MPLVGRHCALINCTGLSTPLAKDLPRPALDSAMELIRSRVYPPDHLTNEEVMGDSSRMLRKFVLSQFGWGGRGCVLVIQPLWPGLPGIRGGGLEVWRRPPDMPRCGCRSGKYKWVLYPLGGRRYEGSEMQWPRSSLSLKASFSLVSSYFQSFPSPLRVHPVKRGTEEITGCVVNAPA